MRAFVSFLLVLVVSAAFLSAYLSLLSSNPTSSKNLEYGSKAILVEKRFYAVSDVQYSLYQSTRSSLLFAKQDKQKLALSLLSFGVPAEFIEKSDWLQLSKKYIYLKMLESSSRLKATYPEYDIVFWCGSMQSSQEKQLVSTMDSSHKAFKCPNCFELENPICENTFGIIDTGLEWRLVPSDPTSQVPIITPFADAGIGISVFDPATNQSSAQFINQIFSVMG